MRRFARRTLTRSFLVPPAALHVAAAVVVVALVIAGCGQLPADPGLSTPPSDAPTDVVWRNVDVGAVSIGGVSEADGQGDFVVTASGSDVWNDSDGFHFTYQELVGDGALTVRVDSLDAAHEWTKVGVMVREDLSPEARNAFVLLTDFNGALFQRRDVRGGSTSDTLSDGTYMRAFDPRAPWWLRIERQGGTVIGSHSPDGESWSELGRVSIPLPDEALIGLAVTSRSPDEVATAAFSNVVLARAEAGEPEDPDDTALPPVPITGPTDEASYVRSTADFPNPERGWHGCCDPDDYASIRRDGHTLVRRYVRLDDYRDSAIPASFLEELRSDLSALRQHGLKIVLRFSYNFGREEDASRDRILQHIGQVAPILQEHTDVIAVLQAGFIGAWGEWHSSTNDLLDLDDRTAITNALLDAMDESRMIQIRYPYRARDMFPTPPTASTAFDGSDASRVGQVNDCFVSSSSDGGTFLDDEDYAYTDAVTRWTVMGGETCSIAGLNDRNDGGNALALMERFHFDYLNHDFYVPIIDKWRDQGYYDEITRRLGYRYVLRSTVSEAASEAGGTFSLNVEVENEGFGKLYNPRPVNVVLRPVGGGAAVTLRAADDARLVMPGPGDTRVVPFTVRLPDGLAAGAYDVHLELPDAASTLDDDPRYAIRFANEGVWNDATGENALDVTLDVQ